MQFSVFGIDFFPKDNLFGVWLFGYKNFEDINRHMLLVYWNDGELLVDIFYKRILTTP